MIRAALSWLSPAGSRGRLSILIYHRVRPQPDPLFPDEVDAASFEAQMHWVREWFRVLPLGEAIEALYRGRVPARALAVTFDDGYADNHEVAAPVLQRLGLSATFFVATGFRGGRCMWNDRVIEAVRHCRDERLDLAMLGLGAFDLRSDATRRRAIDVILAGIKHLEPQRREAHTEAIVECAGGLPTPSLMMLAEQWRGLQAMGMNIGAHTVSHPILTRLSPQAARAEMADSKAQLESVLGREIELFAYPNGVPGQDYSTEHVAMARQCGFRAALSTQWAAASAISDRFQLPRFTPWDRRRWRFGARLLDNYRRGSGPPLPAAA